MTKPTTTQNDTATVGAQLIAPEASPEQGQKGGVSGWREITLSDFVNIKHGYAFSGKGITTENTGQILVTPGNF